jgi:predicted lipoprotein with Yx(FWY)xxD motif
MTAEKVLKSKTLYAVLAIVAALFVWLVYTGQDVELFSISDTMVKNWVKVKKSVVFVKTDATAGTFLTDAKGMNLYTTTLDEAACTSTCAIDWPAYTVRSQFVKVEGSATGTVSVIKLGDNKFQITYNGKPLHYYAKDTKAGELAGTKVQNWFAARP